MSPPGGFDTGRLRPGDQPRLHQLRRRRLHHEQSGGSERSDDRRRHLGLLLSPRLQLAPPDLAVAHARHPALRPERGEPPPDEPSFPHRQCPSPLSDSPGDDRSPLAERGGGGPLRPPPAPRGIGGLGGRTQGCPLRALLDAHALVLPSLREKSGCSPLLAAFDLL